VIVTWPLALTLFYAPAAVVVVLWHHARALADEITSPKST